MDILTESRDGILHIAFNRPQKMNAITAAMYQALADAFKTAEQDPAIRAILISGQEHVFTAGNDVEDFLKNPPKGEDSPVFQFLWQLSHASKPIVAAVSGSAIGVGTTMLLHCDLVYASNDALFKMPFTQLGLCPEGASSLLLPRLAGYQRAAEKLLLGEGFSAHEAKDMGLVNQILPFRELLPYAEAQAARLVALPASSIRITKRLMRGANTTEIEERIVAESEQFIALLASPEAREAFTAFMQKRKPDFVQFS